MQYVLLPLHAIGVSGAGPEEVVRHMLGQFPIRMICIEQIHVFQR